jgi:hypothetical protein
MKIKRKIISGKDILEDLIEILIIVKITKIKMMEILKKVVHQIVII